MRVGAAPQRVAQGCFTSFDPPKAKGMCVFEREKKKVALFCSETPNPGQLRSGFVLAALATLQLPTFPVQM